MSDHEDDLWWTGEQEALAQGLEIVKGDNRTLLCDFDGEKPEHYGVLLQKIEQNFGIVCIEEWASKSGRPHHHVMITMKTECTVAERVALQGALGSDPVRNMLAIFRLHQGIEEPIRLFRPPDAERIIDASRVIEEICQSNK